MPDAPASATDPEQPVRVRAIGARLKLRGAEAKLQAQATVLRLTGELADLAHHSSRDATRVLVNARLQLASAGAHPCGGA